jgi:hypothetical protein
MGCAEIAFQVLQVDRESPVQDGLYLLLVCSKAKATHSNSEEGSGRVSRAGLFFRLRLVRRVSKIWKTFRMARVADL